MRIKIIRPVYETLTIKEPVPDYLKATRKIQGAEDVNTLFRFLVDEARENFLVLHLNTKNRILCADALSRGSLNASIVHPREVFNSALLSAAAAIICVHNHPSGDTTPSAEDTIITKRLIECGRLLGVRVLDHVILGNEGFYSFFEHSDVSF